jgi:hypothetical protein
MGKKVKDLCAKVVDAEGRERRERERGFAVKQ